ncbi:MAG: MerR family transcriptional regulator, partial [Microlunatus sp.]|nr:MerR family transcriptional regulator [Microlunatus sp.]
MADVTSAGMRVGEAAEATGQTPRALRYYDKLGLAGPSRHSAGGHRLYTAADIRRLCAVALLRTVGLSIAEIATVLDSPTADLNTVINQQLDRLEESMTELGTLRGRLRAVVDD